MHGRDMQATAGVADHESASRMSAPGPEPEADVSDDAVSSITIDVAENGGFIARVSYKSPPSKHGGLGPYIDGKSFAFSSRDELDGFLDDQLGVAEPAITPQTPIAARPAAEEDDLEDMA